MSSVVWNISVGATEVLLYFGISVLEPLKFYCSLEYQCWSHRSSTVV